MPMVRAALPALRASALCAGAVLALPTLALAAPPVQAAAGGPAGSDLRISQASNPSTVVRGGQVAYDLTVVNDGPETEPNAVVTPVLPAGFTAEGFDLTRGACVASSQSTHQGTRFGVVQDLSCQLGQLGPGEIVTVRVTALVSPSAADASVARANVDGSNPDPDLSDNSASVTTLVHTAPVAEDDAATVATNGHVTVPVLDNDRDPDGDPLSVTGVVNDLPTYGTVAVDSGRAVTYTPSPGFRGVDTFSYRVSDGQGGTDVATVTVTVENAPPVAVDDQATTPQATPVTVRVLDNDVDANGADTLTVVPGSVTTPLDALGVARGTATLHSDGTVIHSPPPGFTGSVGFSYQVTDGVGGTDAAVVAVTVT
ncbi:MAG: Ig-like domain-containing protein [Carbonactinosporaceae bacterium]